MREVNEGFEMSEVEFFAAPGYGADFLAKLRYHQAVRVGNRVEISGQGGWDDGLRFPDDLDEEIVAAFDNVERTLALAGATWRNVIAVDSFHVAVTPDFSWEAHNRVMVEQFRTRMGERAPIWTEIGVASLAAPGMRIEIRVTAIVD